MGRGLDNPKDDLRTSDHRGKRCHVGEFYCEYDFVNLAADRANRMHIPVATALMAIDE
jgi:hypothetical protein